MGSILVVNAGSTSLKLHLVFDDERVQAVEALDAATPSEIQAVGHRVVHGGPDLVEPAIVDESILASIRELVRSLAPQHTCAFGHRRRETRLSGAPHVAVFDTAFHTTIPAEAATYALPRSGAKSGESAATAFTDFPCSGHPSGCPSFSATRICARSSVTLAVVARSRPSGADARSIRRWALPLSTACRWRRARARRSGRSSLRPRAHGMSIDELELALNEESSSRVSRREEMSPRWRPRSRSKQLLRSSRSMCTRLPNRGRR